MATMAAVAAVVVAVAADEQTSAASANARARASRRADAAGETICSDRIEAHRRPAAAVFALIAIVNVRRRRS